jgi:hypothetical protein
MNVRLHKPVPTRANLVALFASETSGGGGGGIGGLPGNGPDINGLHTFLDPEHHNRLWLKLDNFHDAAATKSLSTLDMLLTATKAGFTLATTDDVVALSREVQPNNDIIGKLVDLMGGGIPRQLIWGFYDDGGDKSQAGWMFTENGMNRWEIDPGTTPVAQGFFFNAGINGAVDQGIWAYLDR